MAITLNELRNEIDQADSLTGWTGVDVTGTSNPTPIEATDWLGANVGAEIFVSYHTISATNLSDAIIYCWVFSRLALGDTADTNGGLMIMLADGTPDRIGYKVNGADLAAFRHDQGPTGWQCPALDTTSLPASPYVDAGVAGNIDLTNIVEVGTIVNSLSAAPGMNPTYSVDIMRWLDVTANNGCAADIVGGTSGTPGLWSEIATADRQIGNQQAHGLVRELAAGAFGVQGPLRFGNATGSSSSWFEDSNITVVFEDRGFRTDLYKIFITDNGTGTTTFRLHGAALIAPTGVGAEFDADTDTDVTDVVLDNGSRIAGFIGGIGLQSGHTVTDTVITDSGQVRAKLEWNVNTNPDGLLDNMTFDKTSGTAHHAIEFGTAIADAADFTLTGCAFGTDFSATEDGSVGDETFHFLDTTGSITLNLVLCTGNFGYRTEGVAVNIVADPITTTVTVTDNDAAPLLGARVILEAASSAGDLPYLENPVSISRSGTTATADHTGHGIPDGKKVVIRGATDALYNGVFVISVTDVDTYTYTMGGTPAASPASGTITASGVILEGTTDSSGQISDSRTITLSQPVTGRISKGTNTPYFKDSPLNSIVDNTLGLSLSTQLILDE